MRTKAHSPVRVCPRRSTLRTRHLAPPRLLFADGLTAFGLGIRRLPDGRRTPQAKPVQHSSVASHPRLPGLAGMRTRIGRRRAGRGKARQTAKPDGLGRKDGGDGRLDVAVIFSQDQDFVEVAEEIRNISRSEGRWLKIVSAFPSDPYATAHRGINKTDWFRMDQEFHDACLDPRDYRPTRLGRGPAQDRAARPTRA